MFLTFFRFVINDIFRYSCSGGASSFQVEGFAFDSVCKNSSIHDFSVLSRQYSLDLIESLGKEFSNVYFENKPNSEFALPHSDPLLAVEWRKVLQSALLSQSGLSERSLLPKKFRPARSAL